MKVIIPLIIFIISSCLTNAQVKFHFPESFSFWSELFFPFDDTINPCIASYHCYGLQNNDTVIQSTTYHKLYSSKDTLFSESECIGGLREDSAGRVFFNGRLQSIFGSYPAHLQNRDILLFDFSVRQGDTLRNKPGIPNSVVYNLTNGNDWLVVKGVDSIFLAGNYRKRIYFEGDSNSWVEGIGNIKRGLLFSSGITTTNGPYNYLICFRQNNACLYQKPGFLDCYPEYPGGISKNMNKICQLHFYPNPADERCMIKYPEEITDKTIIEVITLTGDVLFFKDISGLKSLEICTKDFPDGFYLIRCFKGDGTSIYGKIIVCH